MEAWIVMLCVTILLLGMSLTSLSQVANAEDTKYIALFLFSFMTFISWFILFIGFMTETERLNGAKRFNNKFTPWLRRKLAEEKKVPTSAGLISIVRLNQSATTGQMTKILNLKICSCLLILSTESKS